MYWQRHGVSLQMEHSTREDERNARRNDTTMMTREYSETTTSKSGCGSLYTCMRNDRAIMEVASGREEVRTGRSRCYEWLVRRDIQVVRSKTLAEGDRLAWVGWWWVTTSASQSFSLHKPMGILSGVSASALRSSWLCWEWVWMKTEW